MTIADHQVVLAIDASSALSSIVLAQGQACLGQQTWQASRGNSGILVKNIAAVCRAANMPWEKLDLILIGCGPGQYASLRASVAAAQAIQLPSQGRVCGIPSAYALLVAARTAHPNSPGIIICGDARRNNIWMYHWQPTSQIEFPPMQCVNTEALQSLQVAQGTSIISPDYARLQPRLPIPAAANWIDADRHPDATDLIQAARQDPSIIGPPDIHYVHPPVFVPPSP